jgi:hypothetical protein
MSMALAARVRVGAVRPGHHTLPAVGDVISQLKAPEPDEFWTTISVIGISRSAGTSVKVKLATLPTSMSTTWEFFVIGMTRLPDPSGAMVVVVSTVYPSIVGVTSRGFLRVRPVKVARAKAGEAMLNLHTSSQSLGLPSVKATTNRLLRNNQCKLRELTLRAEIKI